MVKTIIKVRMGGIPLNILKAVFDKPTASMKGASLVDQ